MGMYMGRGYRRMFQDLDQEKPTISKEIIFRILKYFKPYWKAQLLVFLTVALVSALGLIPPMIVKFIIDDALLNKNMELLANLCGASIGTAVLIGLISVGQSYLNTWISKHIVYDLRNQVYVKLQSMHLGFFTKTKTGDIISRINNDVSGVEHILSGTIVGTVSNIATAIFVLIAMIIMDWRLTIIGIFLLPTFILPTRKVGKARWRLARVTHEKMSELNQIIQETLSISGAILIKIFTREKDEIQKFKNISKEIVGLQLKETIVGRWFFMFISIFSSIGPALIYLFGGYLIIKDQLTIGAVVTFLTLLGRLYGPTTQLFNIHVDISRSLALFERIFEYLDMTPAIQDNMNPIELEDVKGEIKFNNVFFSYQEGVPILKDINFHVQPGQMIALVGPSGAGKSTITNLVPRLYDPDEGSVEIDGHDIRDLSVKSLRSHIGVVTQDTFLFNATIKENILYGRPDATDEEVIEACKAAYIHDFIMSLTKGYDTIVGERGIKLSGGEKQRIAIARAILKDPDIIILDEATSSLDSHAEALIKAAMKPLLANRTSLVIAHRLSTILAADMILVIDDGEIVERGTHEELLKLGGIYSHLYNEQFNPKH